MTIEERKNITSELFKKHLYDVFLNENLTASESVEKFNEILEEHFKDLEQEEKQKKMISIRVPADILADFDEVCSTKGKTRTTMLVEYMKRTSKRKKKQQERSNTHENI